MSMIAKLRMNSQAVNNLKNGHTHKVLIGMRALSKQWKMNNLMTNSQH